MHVILGSTACIRKPKHEGYDRTGDYTTRVKITQNLEEIINDGLYNYEMSLLKDYDSDDYTRVKILIHNKFRSKF